MRSVTEVSVDGVKHACCSWWVAYHAGVRALADIAVLAASNLSARSFSSIEALSSDPMEVAGDAVIAQLVMARN